MVVVPIYGNKLLELLQKQIVLFFFFLQVLGPSLLHPAAMMESHPTTVRVKSVSYYPYAVISHISCMTDQDHEIHKEIKL